MTMLIKWILFALLIMLIAWIIPGISVSGFWGAMFVVVIISLVNLFVRPLVTFISIPINILTLGLFSLVINTLLFLLVAKLSPGFTIDGFLSGFIGAFILSVCTPFIDKINFNKNS